MADFSEYTGPSADWIALEPTLPKLPDVGPEELRQIVNTMREELSAQGMASGQWCKCNCSRRDRDVTLAVDTSSSPIALI